MIRDRIVDFLLLLSAVLVLASCANRSTRDERAELRAELREARARERETVELPADDPVRLEALRRVTNLEARVDDVEKNAAEERTSSWEEIATTIGIVLLAFFTKGAGAKFLTGKLPKVT